jgi:hypothetical protein
MHGVPVSIFANVFIRSAFTLWQLFVLPDFHECSGEGEVEPKCLASWTISPAQTYEFCMQYGLQAL